MLNLNAGLKIMHQESSQKPVANLKRFDFTHFKAEIKRESAKTSDRDGPFCLISDIKTTTTTTREVFISITKCCKLYCPLRLICHISYDNNS